MKPFSKSEFEDIFSGATPTTFPLTLDTISDIELLMEAHGAFTKGLLLAKHFKVKPDNMFSIMYHEVMDVTFELLQEINVNTIDKNVTLYVDEVHAMLSMCETLIEYFESQEMYERCAIIMPIKLFLTDKIKLVK